MSNQSYRTDSYYISPRLMKAMRLVSKALKHNGSGQPLTADALAEDVIRQWLRLNHQEVMDWIDKQDEARDEFEKELAKKIGPSDPLSRPAKVLIETPQQ